MFSQHIDVLFLVAETYSIKWFTEFIKILNWIYVFTYNWYISFCREKRAGKIVSMFPPKYLPFSSYIISPFLIIFSLSLPYYLSPFLSFPTSIISLFSFHPLIIYLPSSHFLLSPTIPERSPSFTKKKIGLDTLLSS